MASARSDAPGGAELSPGEAHEGEGRSVQALAAARPPLRAVFMGTPDFAARILARLLAAPHVRVAAVFTQPDRPAGRGKKIIPPPVKLLAEEHGLPVLQPVTFKAGPEGDAAAAQLAAFSPDVLLVAAYGLILPRRVLAIPKRMPINVHASLLPKYRGAAPIQRAIMAGESVTGVTIMLMEEGLDSGPILMQRAVGIDINDSSASLHDELAEEGAELLVQALERLSAGTLAPIAQDEALATYAPKLTKEEGRLDFSLPPAVLHARIRGLTPWPGAAMYLRRQGQVPLLVTPGPGRFPLTPAMQALAGERLPALKAGPAPVQDPGQAPGMTPPGGRAEIIGVADKALLLTCGDGCYAFSSLRPTGRGSMDGQAFYNGYLTGAVDAHFTGS